MQNDLLKLLKEGDIVMFEANSNERAPYQMIVRLTELKFIPKDGDADFDWLDFKGEPLYTNWRLHESMIEEWKNGHGGMNCLGISEIIPKDLIERFALLHNMWKVDEFLLSDVELEAKRKRVEYLLNI